MFDMVTIFNKTPCTERNEFVMSQTTEKYKAVFKFTYNLINGLLLPSQTCLTSRVLGSKLKVGSSPELRFPVSLYCSCPSEREHHLLLLPVSAFYSSLHNR